ncbi:hypothetical protein [Brachybacterium epidermidis]|uniref:hypothetical protein n=1 Tax=Brachybacterium epidermidis TaxID=2781983 RepID=UPI00398EBBFA
MTARTMPRRTRALAALAGAVLLGLSACGTAQDPSSADGEQTTVAAAQGQPDEDPERTDGSTDPQETQQDPERTGDATEPTDEATAAEGDAADGSDAPRSIVLVSSVEDRLQEEGGERRVAAEDLAVILQDLGGAAEEPLAGAEPAACETDLRYVAGADVRCTVTASFDGSDRDTVFYAHPMTTPGGQAGILFTADDPLTEEARWATFHEGVETVMLGQGGAYGMEPIPADQLVDDVQGVVDFDSWHEDLGTQEWDLTVESCEGDLDFERLAPVRCNATGADGEPRTMWALPGTLFGQEPGLIVSAELGTGG